MVKVGINGFGRIGRNVLRAALGNPDIQIVAINDLTDSKTLAHLLKYDSLLGTLPVAVEAADGALSVDGQSVIVYSERDPARIPWRDAGWTSSSKPPGSLPNVKSGGPHSQRRRETGDHLGARQE